MTNMEKALLFGSIGAGALSSAVGARQNSKNQAQSELDAMVQRQMAALQNKQQTSQNLQDQRQQGWKDQTSQSPLGGEQSFLQKQRLAQVLFPQIANFKPAMPTDPGVAGAYVPPTNLLGAFGDSRFLDTFSDQATATSLADRRKLMAGLNPDYEFSSLGNFGLDSSFDGGVNRAQQDAAGRRQAYENTQAQLADSQLALAGQQGQQQQGQQQQQKSGGVKGFLGGLLKTAAPFASFIPGVGPIAAIGLGAAGGALGNKMQGGGLVSGALQGGVGAGIGAAGKSLASGQGLNPFNNGAAKAMSGIVPGTSMNQLVADSMSGPSFAGSGPYNAAGDIQSLLQQPQSSFKQLPQQDNMSSVISGFKPQSFQIPPQQTGFGPPPQQQPPMAVSHQQGQPLSTNMFGQQRTPEIQQLIDQVRNSGIGKGLTSGGLNMGMMPGLGGPAVPQAGQQAGQAAQPKLIGSGATPQAMAAGRPQLPGAPSAPQLGPGPSMPKQIGPGQYNMGPVGSSSPAQGSTFNLPKFGQTNMDNQQGAMNIINAVSKQFGISQQEAAQMIASPQAQQMFRNLPTAPSPYAGLSPQQMMQMVVRGGG